MHKKYNHFIILSVVLFSIFAVYSYFDNQLKSEAAGDGSLTSSLGSVGVVPVSDTNKTSEDTAFLMKLNSLTRIRIDTSLFSNQSFNLLNDNNIKLEPVPYGRINPFAPTEERIIISKTISNVITNPATLISDKSAVLNGGIEGPTSSNIYFEYGKTQSLGKITSKVIPSLIGNFASNISGLDPATTYYFRSVAVVNGKQSFGEILSFNTN